MRSPDTEMPTDPGVKSGRSAAGRRAWRRGRTHGLYTMRRALAVLTTKRLDGRSAMARAVREWKADMRRDLGGDLTRAQETVLELAAQAWVILSSLDDWIARQPSLVTKKRQLLPVIMQRMSVAEGLARHLERLGLERRSPGRDLIAQLAAEARRRPEQEEDPG